MMSPKEIGVRWFQEVWNERKLSAIHELLAEGARGHLEGGQEIVGPEQFTAFQIALVEALPDIKVRVLNSLSDGDDACILWLATATHTGHGMEMAPTGKTVSFRGMTWFHVENGKITEGWDSWNLGGLMHAMSCPAG
ncbi:MAG: ester cyclase [Verrucomicrobiota bacterium]